ncbi:MAG: alpha-galactosidase, partial [Thermotogae bacterium]
MRVFGFPLREGRMVKELGTCQLEVEVERQPFGTMIVGSVKGKPKRLEVCRVSLNGKILFLNNWQSWGLARVMRLSQLRSLPLEKFARFGYSAHPLPELLRKHPVSDYFVFAG